MLEEEIFMQSGHSDWLRNALRSALECDPVTAANDAAFLACVLQRRAARAQESREADPAIELRLHAVT